MLADVRAEHLEARRKADAEVQELEASVGGRISTFREFVAALRKRRQEFKRAGAVATEHVMSQPVAGWQSPEEMESYFAGALARRDITSKQLRDFQGHMAMEMARMSLDDGLVMQLYAGVDRGHADVGAAMAASRMPAALPARVDFTGGLRTLLNEFGHSKNFTLVLFSPDESSYTRELGPLAVTYPAVKVGAPWWHLNSPRGMRTFLMEVVEIAGVHNLAGFDDDASYVLSLPSRHKLWRRVVSDWAASLVMNGEIDEQEALDIVFQLSYAQPKSVYHI